jgi:hypothetical protein
MGLLLSLILFSLGSHLLDVSGSQMAQEPSDTQSSVEG